MTHMFDLSTKELVDLTLWLRQQPKAWNRAATNVLNEFAFGTRTESMSMVRTHMVVRNERFLSSSIRVEKAKFNESITQKKSEVGSIQRERFSGWAEQELGTDSKRTRTQSLLARGGSIKKTVRPSVRMRPGNQYTRPDDYKGRDPHHRAVVMMQVLRREGYRKPFVIHGHRGIRSGLYKFHQRKLMILQDFKEPMGTKRVRWLRGGGKKYFARKSPSGVWIHAYKREMKRGRKVKY